MRTKKCETEKKETALRPRCVSLLIKQLTLREQGGLARLVLGDCVVIGGNRKEEGERT
jgi:hypothetical protein